MLDEHGEPKVILQVGGQNNPCSNLQYYHKQMTKQMMHKRGVFCSVVKAGHIEIGDTITSLQAVSGQRSANNKKRPPRYREASFALVRYYQRRMSIVSSVLRMSLPSPGMGILVKGAKWQATKCSVWPGAAMLRQTGICCLQMSCASQQRVWKRQPLGGFRGRERRPSG